MFRFKNLLTNPFIGKYLLKHVSKYEMKRLLKEKYQFQDSDFILSDRKKISLILYLRIIFDLIRLSIGTPVAYLTFQQPFYRDILKVDRNTFIPRPDTEILLYVAEKINLSTGCSNHLQILECCTGSGALAVSLAGIYPESDIDAFDLKIQCALENVRNLNLENRVHVFRENLFKFHTGRKYDLIISNPPYFNQADWKLVEKSVKKFEPTRAFVAGDDGMRFYTEIGSLAESVLNPEGVLILEIDHKVPDVSRIFHKKGFVYQQIFKDYAGLDRALICSWKPLNWKEPV